MEIKTLTNNTNVTITSCEQELIHIPGSIQPHGFLLGVGESDFVINYCSENAQIFLKKSITDILGQPLNSFFDDEEINGFKSLFQDNKQGFTRPHIFISDKKSCNVTSYVADSIIVLEFEILVEEKMELPDLYIQAKRFVYHTERSDNLKNLCQSIAEETREITGFDRVMIYRFDEQYNGEVFAESKREDLEPFLGLNYPHTDIPSQARELYLKNLIRLLVDVEYQPSPLMTIDKGNLTKNLDLSMSTLRSFSPIHIEYLKNMGVGATFNVSIIRDKKLWGLISCHHYSPKHIAYYTRLAAHLQSVFLSSQIDVRQASDEFETTKDLEKRLSELHEALNKQNDSIIEENKLHLLRKLLNADGIIINYKNNLFSEGILPSVKEIGNLLKHLCAQANKGNLYTSKLIEYYPAAENFSDTVAGIFYLPLDATSQNCVVWTRQEIKKTVNWGGNPHNSIILNKENKPLTPRKSFEIWQESVRFQSKEWLKPEISAAAVVCSTIQHKLHLADLKDEETRYLTLNEKLFKANEELANMNWISTHDLKEPLRKIQMYASIILEKQGTDLPDSVILNITRMQSSASRMQLLIEDLLSYTKILNDDNPFKEIDLNNIMEEVLTELKEDIEGKSASIQVTKLPIIKGIPFQIRQLFINLINNSLKFAKAGVPSVIKIKGTTMKDKEMNFLKDKLSSQYHKITIEDNGIGFSSNYNQDIFKVFHRLHSKQYSGSGIGLSICKKIAEANGGYIEAIGKEGVGATFNIYFHE